ncbi:MAG: hypothetical protein HFH67_06775 [Lachnospiraceae bacterium]|nr:hypothetical protein [Lachnospiraceae bacterium]
MQVCKIRARIPSGILIVVLFCFIYVITVNQLLSEETYVNVTPVGSNEKNFDFLRMIFCILLSVMAYRFAFVNMRNRIAWFTIRILFVSYALPTIMSFCLFSHEKSFEFIIAFIIYWFFLCICCKYITYDFKSVKIRNTFNIFLKIVLPLFFVFAVFVMVNSLEGFQLSIYLGNVYEVRQNFKENSNDIFVFLKSAFGIFVCPAMIVYTIYRNLYFNMIIFSIMQVFLFSFAKDKLYLMLLAIAYLIGFLGRKIYEAFDCYLYLGMITICVGMIVALMGVAQNFLFNIVIRRFLVTPAQLNYIYFEFFYNRPKVWWHQEVFL